MVSLDSVGPIEEANSSDRRSYLLEYRKYFLYFKIKNEAFNLIFHINIFSFSV
jgi:hypothetical protein